MLFRFLFSLIGAMIIGYLISLTNWGREQEAPAEIVAAAVGTGDSWVMDGLVARVAVLQHEFVASCGLPERPRPGLDHGAGPGGRSDHAAHATLPCGISLPRIVTWASM